MVGWIQLSSVRFRFLLVFLLSLTMVHGSSNVKEIQCPNGFIMITSATHNSKIEQYIREAGTNSSEYNTTSSQGYCKAVFTINVCTKPPCGKADVITILKFNPADGEVVKDDDIHFLPTYNQLTVSFRFKALGSYVDDIEEAAKNRTNSKAKPAADKLVELLRFVKKNGFPLDPPRSKEGDWKYVPNLLAPPRISTAMATSAATMTVSNSSISGVTTANPPSVTTIMQTGCPKCECNKAQWDSSAGAAAQGANNVESTQNTLTCGSAAGYIVGMVVCALIATGSLIWAFVEKNKRQKIQNNFEKELLLAKTRAEDAMEQQLLLNFQDAVAVEYAHHRDANKAYTEMRLIEQIQKQIQDLQPGQSSIDLFRELQSKITIVIGLLDSIKFSFLKTRDIDMRRARDDIVAKLSHSEIIDYINVDRTASDVFDELAEREIRQWKANQAKQKELKEEKLAAMKSNKEQSSGQNKNQSDVAKDGADAKGENDQKPKSKGEAAPKSKAEDAPKSKGEAAPKSKAEDAPKSKGEAAPKSKAEDAPKSKGEAAPKSKAENAPKNKAVPK